MPFCRTALRSKIEEEYRLIQELKDKCLNIDFLQGVSPDEEYVYEVHYMTDKELAILAVAQYNNCHTYAVNTSENVTEEELEVFEFFIKDVKKYLEPDDQILVFSKKSYDAVKKYNYGRPVNVILREV